jgi:hypothetical protein
MKPSTKSLSEAAEALTDRHLQARAAVPASAAAAVSPLHEVLIAEAAAGLPPPLAEQLRGAGDVGSLLDWLGAGAVYSWIADDPFLREQFLHELKQGPSRAGLALARALAARMEPPPRDAAWHERDRAGLALQMIVAVLLLGGRAFLFAWLAAPARDGFCDVTSLGELLRGLVGADLFRGTDSHFYPLTIFLLWLVGEAVLGPRLLEEARCLPARLQQKPPPLPWRAEVFSVFWAFQAVALLLAGVARLVWGAG